MTEQLVNAMAETLERLAALVTAQSRMIEKMATDTAAAQLQRDQANEVIRTIIQTVDPDIWQNGQANTQVLIDRIADLAKRDQAPNRIVDVPLPTPPEES